MGGTGRLHEGGEGNIFTRVQHSLAYPVILNEIHNTRLVSPIIMWVERI